VIPGATIRWRGSAVSSSRRDRVTGEPKVYPMMIYEDGRAECGCPNFAFRGINGKSEDQKYRYRCKHLEQAFRNLGENASAEQAVMPVSDPAPVAVVEPDPIDEEFTPIARR
jgi:hypothetical protein